MFFFFWKNIVYLLEYRKRGLLSSVFLFFCQNIERSCKRPGFPGLFLYPQHCEDNAPKVITRRALLGVCPRIQLFCLAYG